MLIPVILIAIEEFNRSIKPFVCSDTLKDFVVGSCTLKEFLLDCIKKFSPLI